MPFSSGEGKAWVLEVVKGLHPESVLDVGPGWGTYGRLLRPSLPDTHFIAVEVFPDYIEQFNLGTFYDEVHLADIRHWDWFDVDLVIFGDVLEHLDKEDALAVWGKAREYAKYLIISVPTSPRWHEQGEVNGNAAERHLHHWTFEEVMDLDGIINASRGDDVSVFLAEGVDHG